MITIVFWHRGIGCKWVSFPVKIGSTEQCSNVIPDFTCLWGTWGDVFERLKAIVNGSNSLSWAGTEGVPPHVRLLVACCTPIAVPWQSPITVFFQPWSDPSSTSLKATTSQEDVVKSRAAGGCQFSRSMNHDACRSVQPFVQLSEHDETRGGWGGGISSHYWNKGRFLILKLGLKPQTALWRSEDRPKRPHSIRSTFKIVLTKI